MRRHGTGSEVETTIVGVAFAISGFSPTRERRRLGETEHGILDISAYLPEIWRPRSAKSMTDSDVICGLFSREKPPAARKPKNFPRAKDPNHRGLSCSSPSFDQSELSKDAKRTFFILIGREAQTVGL